MKRVVEHYPFAEDVNRALDMMTDKELIMAVYHEIGEIKGSRQLGSQWLDILVQLPRSRGEVLFRAVKDHLADSLSTLPKLLQDFHPESLHFYMANLSSMRKTIAPRLVYHYQQWLETQSLDALTEYIHKASSHWLHLGQEMIRLKGEYPNLKAYDEQLNILVENNYL